MRLVFDLHLPRRQANSETVRTRRLHHTTAHTPACRGRIDRTERPKSPGSRLLPVQVGNPKDVSRSWASVGRYAECQRRSHCPEVKNSSSSSWCSCCSSAPTSFRSSPARSVHPPGSSARASTKDHRPATPRRIRRNSAALSAAVSTRNRLG